MAAILIQSLTAGLALDQTAWELTGGQERYGLSEIAMGR
jgi:hypothetical protein